MLWVVGCLGGVSIRGDWSTLWLVNGAWIKVRSEWFLDVMLSFEGVSIRGDWCKFWLVNGAWIKVQSEWFSDVCGLFGSV